MDDMAEEGRVTDDVMGHLTTGEIVIPLNISTNERAFEQLALMFELSGMDIREFIVGHQQNKINPETGHPEFWGIKVGPVSVGSSGVKVGGTKIIGEKGMNVITQPIKTAGDVIETGVKTGVTVAKDIGNTAVNVTKDLAKGDIGGAIDDTVSGAGAVIKDTASGTVQMAKDAVKGTFKQVANIMDVVGILPNVPKVNAPTSDQTAGATVTQGDQNQRNQSVTDVEAAAGGGASSLTPRTVAGPDNDYKLNKSAVLGL